MSIEETKSTKSKAEESPYIGQTMRDLEERFAPRIEEAKEQLDVMNKRVQGFIRENPGTALIGALGIGYLIGKLASRR